MGQILEFSQSWPHLASGPLKRMSDREHCKTVAAGVFRVAAKMRYAGVRPLRLMWKSSWLGKPFPKGHVQF